MSIRFWRFLTIVLAALSLTMESAHVLELPQKMLYNAEMYTAVNGTLYRYFALVGGVYQVGALAAALVLTLLVRKRVGSFTPSFRWTLAGFVLLLLAFGAWLSLVAPVNRRIAEAVRNVPESVPALWMQLRNRWEYGHAAGFVLQLLGFMALAVSIIMETPRHSPSDRAPAHSGTP